MERRGDERNNGQKTKERIEVKYKRKITENARLCKRSFSSRSSINVFYSFYQVLFSSAQHPLFGSISMLPLFPLLSSLYFVHGPLMSLSHTLVAKNVTSNAFELIEKYV